MSELEYLAEEVRKTANRDMVREAEYRDSSKRFIESINKHMEAADAARAALDSHTSAWIEILTAETGTVG